MGIFKRIKNIVKSKDAEDSKLDKKSRSLFDLGIGDIVSIFDVDYEVEASMTLNDNGWEWIEYKLKDGRKTYWLSVEQDDDLEISFYETIVAEITEPPKTYDHDGVTYLLDESGSAIVKNVKGKIGVKNGKQVKYYDYCDREEEHLLSIEFWDNDMEVSIGTPIEDFNIEIYPRS